MIFTANTKHTQHSNIMTDLKKYINGHDIPVGPAERSRLVDREMLNDNNVNRILRDLFVYIDALPSVSDLFVLDSRFMHTLTDGGVALRDVTGQRVYRFTTVHERAIEIARGWNLNILRKRYVCVVVNMNNAHWMLYIVLTPFAPSSCRDPLFLVLDSCNHTLQGSQDFHKANLKCLCAFFTEYARARGASAGIAFDGWHRGYKLARVPTERAHYASGMHVCMYVSRFCAAGAAGRADMIRRTIDDTADAAENTLFSDVTPEIVEKAYVEIVGGLGGAPPPLAPPTPPL